LASKNGKLQSPDPAKLRTGRDPEAPWPEGGTVLLELSMTPLDKGESVSEYVARSLDIIGKSGLPYKLNPMGTVIEGTLEEVLKVVKECHERMAQDCVRISTSIKMDYRKGRTGRIESKVESIEKRLGKNLSK
jgi:uncharacterized protein (TIGR00106 family)